MPRVDMFYAVKCNSDPVLLRTLAALNIGFDCASKNEIDAVINLEVLPSRIVYANCYKGASHLRHAAQLGVDFTVFDNKEELLKIKLLYPCARLLLRIDSGIQLCSRPEETLKEQYSLVGRCSMQRRAWDMKLTVLDIGGGFPEVAKGSADLFKH
ncbi:ornithine decarboxylase [Caerostris extrusa]|uniref:Ornithine decarboxylase n=1 Tax=Caerostris extrusa TaxID=172846 RepID=A0AAV4PLQ6_CAEEX|nr:ornithine decarboxylase [Caerostris extrusa]